MIIPSFTTLNGSLFQYTRSPSLVAFESGAISNTHTNISIGCPNKCILIGGLSDGLIPTPYTQLLEQECLDSKWSLVQPILSSSYLGFGNGSLDRDTNEIETLLTYLEQNRNAQNFAIVGHSTGCQNAIHFLKYAKPDLIQKVKFVALQAPVSDREGPMEDKVTYEKNINIAKQLKKDGKEFEMMPRECFWAPITAYRFLSLQDVGGDDDFFSSDFTNEELIDRLGHVGKLQKSNFHVLVAFSGADEYVAKHIHVNDLLHKMCHAMNFHCQDSSAKVAVPLLLEKANHNLSQAQGDAEIFIDSVGKYLRIALSS